MLLEIKQEIVNDSAAQPVSLSLSLFSLSLIHNPAMCNCITGTQLALERFHQDLPILDSHWLMVGGITLPAYKLLFSP